MASSTVQRHLSPEGVSPKRQCCCRPRGITPVIHFRDPVWAEVEQRRSQVRESTQNARPSRRWSHRRGQGHPYSQSTGDFRGGHGQEQYEQEAVENRKRADTSHAACHCGVLTEIHSDTFRGSTCSPDTGRRSNEESAPAVNTSSIKWCV